MTLEYEIWSLMDMGEKKMVKGMPPIDHPNHLCEVCILDKHNRSCFPKEATFRATKPLEFVHIDMCGQINPP